MKEYVLWATNPLTGQRRPISEKVYDKRTNAMRAETAKRNGWTNITTQVIDLDHDNTAELFKRSVRRWNVFQTS